MKLGLGLILLAAALPAAAADTPGHTQVVLLGTGNPPADPDRSGPATAREWPPWTRPSCAWSS